MGVLDVIGGLAKTAGAGFNAYGEEKSTRATQALAQAKAAREAERDRVLNALTQREIATPRLGDANYASSVAGVDAAKAEATKPIEVAKAVETAQGIAPVQRETHAANALVDQGTHATNRTFDNANPAPVQPSYTFPVGADPDGKPQIFRGNTKTGEIETTGVAAKPDAGAAGDVRKRETALQNVQGALDAFERQLTTGGSRLLPSAAKSELETNYNNVLLQMKEAYNLGVLNGPDYMLMQKILSDPSSVRGRVEALGSGDEQAARVLAQIAQVRERMKGISAAPQAGSPATTDTEFDALLAKYKRPPV